MKLTSVVAGVLCISGLLAGLSGHFASSQTAPSQRPDDLRLSPQTGIPIVYPYHGRLLNHDLSVIPATPENIRNVLEHFIEGIASKAGGDIVAKARALRSQAKAAAKQPGSDLLVDLRIAAWLVDNLEPSTRTQYAGLLAALETWATASPSSQAARELGRQQDFQATMRSLDLAQQTTAVAASSDYLKACRDAGVPIPPDWGSPDWKFVGILPKRYTFSGGADGPTQVWGYAGKETRGACIALPRTTQATKEIALLGIICQSAISGKACFWDNVDRKTGERLDGAATKNMKISEIQDGSVLKENCTNCHRGYNAFVIHPGTPLDLGQEFEIHPLQRYEPISGQRYWGNPPPLIKDKTPPCGSCHEIPALGDDNNTDPKMPSAYCKTILEKATNLTMPYVGSPAGWDAPREGYQEHVNQLKKLCETQTVAGGQNR